MRKLFWCSLAAGAALCCAAGAVVFVSLHPDCAQAVARLAGRAAPPAPHAGQPAMIDADDLIPAAPTPADESPDPPAPPAPGTHLPPAVAALIPPIVIHEDDDLNASHDAGAEKSVAAAAGHMDVESPVKAAHEFQTVSRPGAPVMPRCIDDEDATPRMPRCADDEGDGKVSSAYEPFDACAFWMGFFSAPTRLFPDPSAGRCEEDVAYPQQYPGCPYTGRTATHDQPARDAVKQAVFPAIEDGGERPASKGIEDLDPLDPFKRP